MHHHELIVLFFDIVRNIETNVLSNTSAKNRNVKSLKTLHRQENEHLPPLGRGACMGGYNGARTMVGAFCHRPLCYDDNPPLLKNEPLLLLRYLPKISSSVRKLTNNWGLKDIRGGEERILRAAPPPPPPPPSPFDMVPPWMGQSI